MITLWIRPSFSKEKRFVSGALDLIYERLTFIKPPAIITRIPFSNHMETTRIAYLVVLLLVTNIA